jgi:hypothetical protein
MVFRSETRGLNGRKKYSAVTCLQHECVFNVLKIYLKDFKPSTLSRTVTIKFCYSIVTLWAYQDFWIAWFGQRIVV